LAEQLAASRQLIRAQWEQTTEDADAPVRALSGQIDSQQLGGLIEEITQITDMLTALLDCDRVGVRLTTLTGPMCPRFHADQIACRLLTTISGPGTEWIPSDDVDRARFADRDGDAPPIQPGKEIKHLPGSNWSLLKGGMWDEKFSGVVHRSPHRTGERLLLSMDPVFTSKDAE